MLLRCSGTLDVQISVLQRGNSEQLRAAKNNRSTSPMLLYAACACLFFYVLKCKLQRILSRTGSQFEGWLCAASSPNEKSLFVQRSTIGCTIGSGKHLKHIQLALFAGFHAKQYHYRTTSSAPCQPDQPLQEENACLGLQRKKHENKKQENGSRDHLRAQVIDAPTVSM